MVMFQACDSVAFVLKSLKELGIGVSESECVAASVANQNLRPWSKCQK